MFNLCQSICVILHLIFNYVLLNNMKIREFKTSDAPVVLGWIKDKTALRKWSAHLYPDFPPKVEDMELLYSASNVFPLTAVDDCGNIVGHLTIRIPDSAYPHSVRLGFIIVDDSLRGKGYGKEMIRQAIEYAKEKLGATKISLGVFLNNPSALRCYESVGFSVVGDESYTIDGEEWKGVEMILR